MEFYCIWSTCHLFLGWVIDTVNMMLSLPPHWENHFKEILSGIPIIQKWISVDKWRRVLEDIFSVAVSLPGSRGLFRHMQEALRHMEVKRGGSG